MRPNEIVLPGITEGRFLQRQTSVYDTWGGYQISQELWDKRIAEGRTDKASHRFILGERVDEGEITEWYRVWADCPDCGERRKVYWAINLYDLNHGGWCIPRRNRKDLPWWKRWFL